MSTEAFAPNPNLIGHRFNEKLRTLGRSAVKSALQIIRGAKVSEYSRSVELPKYSVVSDSQTGEMVGSKPVESGWPTSPDAPTRAEQLEARKTPFEMPVAAMSAGEVIGAKPVPEKVVNPVGGVIDGTPRFRTHNQRRLDLQPGVVIGQTPEQTERLNRWVPPPEAK